MYGPNTNTSGGSIIFYLETQAGYLRQALEQLAARGAGAIEVRAEVEAACDRALQHRFAGTAWTQCDSWYRDPARAASSPTGRATCASTGDARRRWTPPSSASRRCPSGRRSQQRAVNGYDYVIVGAGSAGLRARQPPLGGPAGARAAARGGRRDRSLKVKIPAAFPQQFHTKLDWDYATEPEPHVDGRELFVPRGQDARRLELDERDALRARAPARLRRLGGAGRARLGLPRRAAVLHPLRGQRRAAPRSSTARAARCGSASSARRGR